MADLARGQHVCWCLAQMNGMTTGLELELGSNVLDDFTNLRFCTQSWQADRD